MFEMLKYISVLCNGKKQLLSIILIVILSGIVNCTIAQKLSNYQLQFDKRDMGDGALNIFCGFTVDFEDKDFLVLDFGGNLGHYSIEDLSLSPKYIEYSFNPIAKKLTLYRNEQNIERIELNYIFLNITSILMYADSGVEIWECIYNNNGEFYYPIKRGNRYKANVLFYAPDSLTVVSSYNRNPLLIQNIDQSVPLNFVFLKSEIYEKQIISQPYQFSVYQLIGKKANENRFKLFSNLVAEAIGWFEETYGELYINPEFGTYDYPQFIFHEGNGSFNRYNMGFISASQNKFSTAPNIYPLIHEIGHRWIGEYSLFIDSNQRGYAFIIETLNEFMTLMCIRDVMGMTVYDDIIESYRMQYDKIKGTSQDIHPIDVTNNNNMIVTYRKGVVLLDLYAKEIGYNKLIEAIVCFYNNKKGKYGLKYEDLKLFLDIESLEQ